MRSLILVLLLLNALFLSAQEATNNNLSFDNSLRTESEKLLTEWMDTFLTYNATIYIRLSRWCAVPCLCPHSWAHRRCRTPLNVSG